MGIVLTIDSIYINYTMQNYLILKWIQESLYNCIRDLIRRGDNYL